MTLQGLLLLTLHTARTPFALPSQVPPRMSRGSHPVTCYMRHPGCSLQFLLPRSAGESLSFLLHFHSGSCFLSPPHDSKVVFTPRWHVASCFENEHEGMYETEHRGDVAHAPRYLGERLHTFPCVRFQVACFVPPWCERGLIRSLNTMLLTSIASVNGRA